MSESGYRYAFSLSSSEVKNATPSGTSSLIKHELSRTTSGTDIARDELLLVPRPSQDPADPLNFAMWRKVMALLCVSLFAFVANFTSASISSALPSLAVPGIFGPAAVSTPRLTYFTSVNFLMLGTSNLWWVPLANVFGKRTIILISLLLLTLCSMWAGLTHSYYSVLAARIFMGIGGGPSDTVAPEYVGDLFFVHQRGRAMAVYTVFLAVGSLVGGLSGGYIIASKGGYPWIHWTNVTLSAIALALSFFFVPETLYDRDFPPDSSDEEGAEKHMQARMWRVRNVEISEQYKPYTFARSLRTGTYRRGFSKQVAALLWPLLLPGVWLVALWYAGLVGGTVVISIIGPQFVSKPPYSWNENAGLINLGGIIGTILGGTYTYFITDFFVKVQARKDIHGFTEPETRLWTSLPGLFLATTGLWTAGFSAQYSLSKHAWVGLTVGQGMLAFGLMQAPSVGFNYLIEAYTTIAGDCFVIVVIVRSIISFAWMFFVSAWTEKSGYAEPFGIFGMLMGIFGLLTIPMIILGKRLRIATAKWLPKERML